MQAVVKIIIGPYTNSQVGNCNYIYSKIGLDQIMVSIDSKMHSSILENSINHSSVKYHKYIVTI